MSSYFQGPSLFRPDDLNQLNLNVIVTNQLRANRVCDSLKKPVNKPGTDIYAQSFLQSNKNSKYTNLGRVCCRNPCKCEYVFQYAETNLEVKPPVSVPVVVDIKLNTGYECSDEFSDCLTYCRRMALNRVELEDPGYIKKDTTQRTDVFSSLPSLYSQYICSLIGEELKNEGFNVYLRYSVSSKTPNEFPYYEDIHIGRVCCQYVTFAAQWLGINRCFQTIPR